MAGERFKTLFNIHRIEKIQKLHRRIDEHNVMKYSAKRKKLKVELFIGGKVLVLTERMKKKATPRKFYKQCVQKICYFNKDKTFIIRKIQPIDGIKCYWLKDAKNNRKLAKRLRKIELFAVRGNFVV